MRDKYSDSIRIGIVSSIDPEKGTAKITFPDRDDIVSRDLPVVVPCTLEDKWYYMPDVGERVRVLFDPEAPTRGCILGSYYDDVRKPPEHDDANIQYVLFKDNTLVRYDRKLHTMTINIPEEGIKSVDVYTASDIFVETEKTLHVIVNKKNFNAKTLDKEESVCITVNGNNSNITLTTTNTDNQKVTLEAEIDGQKGDVNITTINYDTDNETTETIIKGQEGKIDLITKNLATGNETAYIKMDGSAKTIDIQGYVTVKGSFSEVPMAIPD